MSISPEIDLGRSLQQVFGESRTSDRQVTLDRDRQTKTSAEILGRFFAPGEKRRQELVILADEVGLGKTYVALAVAVSILDGIRRGTAPAGLPSNKPVALVLTPSNDALYNKWLRESEAFRRDCARHEGALDWLQIACPVPNSSKSGNIVDLTLTMREAARSRPMILIAKLGALGATLSDRDWWRRRALACIFEEFRIRSADRP